MKVSETGGRRTRHRCSEGGLVHIPEVSYAIRGLKECEKNRSNSERDRTDRRQETKLKEAIFIGSDEDGKD